MYFDIGEFWEKSSNWIGNSEFLRMLEAKKLLYWKNAEQHRLKSWEGSTASPWRWKQARDNKKGIRAFESSDIVLKSRHGTTAEEALVTPQFEYLLMSFFESLRIQQRGETRQQADMIPKQKTMDVMRPNLKLFILLKMEQRVDI